jgi:solute:Na+ symporter, SSS family
MTPDAAIVATYFAIALVVGVAGARKLKAASQEEFLTGAHTMSWKQVALAVIAMTADPGVMGFSGLAFLWGLVIHWNAVNMWFSAPFAAFFLLPIYWRTGILTTPEFLERRFNAASRVLVSVLMLSFNIVILAAMLHLGGLVLSELFGWPIFASTLAVLLIAAIYLVTGGMHALLAINRYQSGLVLATIIAVAVVAIYHVGGITGFASIRVVGESGSVLPSTVPSLDWSLFSKQWYPLPAILTWAPLLTIGWLACNFSFVQCFLAARTLGDAQKAVCAVGAWSAVMCGLAYVAGVSMRHLAPGILPDKAFITVITTMFPTGVRGLLIAGLMASLLSAVIGLLMSSSTMATRDIYLKIAPAADIPLTTVARAFQVLVIAIVLVLLPVAGRSRSITAFIQHYMGDVWGVIIAWFLTGAFSRRATPRAAFAGAVAGVLLAVSLDVLTSVNFAYVGLLSFLCTAGVTLVLSRWETPAASGQMLPLTVYGSAGDSVAGATTWAGIWKWAVGSLVVYLIGTIAWEWYLRR